MARIVTTQYRYKRPPKKRKPVTIKVPEVVTVRDRKRAKPSKSASVAVAAPPPANDDRKAVIVRTRPKRGRFGEAEDMTPEEHQRRDMVRRATSEP